MKITIEYGASSDGRISRIFPSAYALNDGRIIIISLDREDSIRISDIPAGELVISKNRAADGSIAEIEPGHSITYNFANG